MTILFDVDVFLTLCHTVPTFKDPETEDFWKGEKEKKEKMLVTSIFSFSHNVFDPSQTKLIFSFTFILLSANASNLDQSKILSFGEKLRMSLFQCSVGCKTKWNLLVCDHVMSCFVSRDRRDATLLHYGSFPFISVVGSESGPSSRDIFVTWP